MPHECTDCGAIYEDGSTQMLDGCDDCGGTTFLFTKDPTVDGRTRGDPDTASPDEAPTATSSETGEDPTATEATETATDTATVTDTSERATAAETTETGDGAEVTATDSGAADGDAATGSTVEDPAQTTARSGIIDAEGDAQGDDADSRAGGASGDVSGAGSGTDDEGPTVSGGDMADGETVTPDTDEIREALMAQFESIKIVEPGSYELNLMNLYDRDEKIIALQEDGRYQVSLPSALED